MPKVFNVTGVCVPERHYMVNLGQRLQEIRRLVDGGQYFVISRARQYGKTTTLRALYRCLCGDYYVVSMDFQTFGNAEFQDENTFALSFADTFVRLFQRNQLQQTTGKLKVALDMLEKSITSRDRYFTLKKLFEGLSDLCAVSDRPVVLMIDEIDSAGNYQVFMDFLSQLRAQYINRDFQAVFQSVILAGVYDIKNLRNRIRPEEEHKYNSPWNIAADFTVDMSFSADEIAAMLQDYEADYHTGMDRPEMAKLLYDYTSGYPYLVSKLCKLMDETVSMESACGSKKGAWSREGFHRAVRLLLTEKNPLFESLIGKLTDYPELNRLLKAMLFTGRTFSYNADEPAIDAAVMFGFVKEQNGHVAVANRIFEMRLYNYFLSSEEMLASEMYRTSIQDRSQFIANGHLNMRRILEKFAIHFNDLYGDCSETFLEEEGRKYFLLYLRPIINGTGNYYVEARTRGLRRTDIIVDYHGKQYVIELKIWHGEEYHNRGERQLVQYLEDYHTDEGYLVSFNFNKTKRIGVYERIVGEKTLIEVIV